MRDFPYLLIDLLHRKWLFCRYSMIAMWKRRLLQSIGAAVALFFNQINPSLSTEVQLARMRATVADCISSGTRPETSTGRSMELHGFITGNGIYPVMMVVVILAMESCARIIHGFLD